MTLVETTQPTHAKQPRRDSAQEWIERQVRRHLAGRERLQAVLISTLQSLTVGVLAVGNDGVVIAANPAACRLLDRELEALATRRIDKVLAPIEESARLIEVLRGLGGGQVSLEWSCETARREERHLNVSAVRALAPWDGQLAGVVLIEDLTEVRRLQAQAEVRHRLTGMGELALNLAHEIRNPLGSIGLLANTLERELADQPELAELAQAIARGVQALEHVVGNTMEFARPRRVAHATVDLRALLAETLGFVRHPLEQKAVAVRFDPELSPAARVAGDTEQLRQVFLNLVLNALQAMDDGGQLTVTVAMHGPFWRVRIEDSGHGIEPAVRERMFDPFFTTRRKGSGIGLAVVHRIVTAHGGNVMIDSTVGEGTVVSVDLPARDQA